MKLVHNAQPFAVIRCAPALSCGSTLGRMPKTPSAEQQGRFFVQLQRLLSEGKFTSTYKYALLIALTRWAVENPDYDESVPLEVEQLAEHLLEVYWPQVRPFEAAERLGEAAQSQPKFEPGVPDPWLLVLEQERAGQRPRVLRLILEEQSLGHESLRQVPEARRDALRKGVIAKIREDALWRLHMVGRQSIQFLYRLVDPGDRIMFEPGIIACLTAFSQLIEQVVRASWLRFVLRCNARVLGTASTQLEGFLFPTGRAGLAVWCSSLQRVQGSFCFYCGDSMHGDAEVDHFLPWSRYPRDLGHNFVLAHRKCNAGKRDHLASSDHLERWCRRNDEHHDRLAEDFDRSRLPHDWKTLRRVAAALYHAAEQSGAAVWNRGEDMVGLDPRWRALLAVG